MSPRPDTGTDRLYTLLPLIYRLRDVAVGEPLRDLLRVIGEQVEIVDEDIEQLYANWFIETCQDWVVPYIGDLIGYRPVTEAALPGGVTTPEGRRLNRILSPRRDVANTIAARRRKGTLALLQQLANDVAGWPARALEFYVLLGLAQSVKHVRLDRGRTADLRNGDALERLETAFDELAHTVSVGRINSARTRTRYNIPSVGLFLWRLKPYSITRAPAFCIDRVRNHYTFSILGNDAPLISRPVGGPDPFHIADEMNVPHWIGGRDFDKRTADYYCRHKSLVIFRDDLSQPVPLERIVPADLSHWAYRPQQMQVAVDPVLGRIAFSARNAPETGVWVSYHYGFSDDMGGGEYWRELRTVEDRRRYTVGSGGPPGPQHHDLIMDAVRHWRSDKQKNPTLQDAVIEITDSGAYLEQIEISLDEGDRLELRAAQGTRPLIRLLDWHTNRPDSLRIRGIPPQAPPEEAGGEPAPAEGEAGPDMGGEPGGPTPEGPEGPEPPEATGEECHPLPRICLNGLLIAGRSVEVVGPVGTLTIRHCTLVPGWSLQGDCEPTEGEKPSLELHDTSANVIVERSIVGSIEVNVDEVETEPLTVRVSDSILDATQPSIEVLSAPDSRHAYAVLTILRSTVIGHVLPHAIALAENCIFDGVVRVARSQTGCVRFCYVTPGSRTPRRYECQPDLTVAAALAPLPPSAVTERNEARAREELRVRPQFNSMRYGFPTYCQLAGTCAAEIRQGADDEAEMGAFHDLFQPQREANLRARIDEYTPAGVAVGFIFVT